MFSKLNYFRRFPDQKINIVILDEFGAVFIKECLPQNSNHIVLPLRKIVFIISFQYLYLLTISLLKRKWKYIIFLRAMIDITSPKVIISFTDNNSTMGELKKLYPDKLVISVQNGLRTENIVSCGWTESTLIPCYYGFGDYERRLMRTLNLKVNNYVIAGSLKMGLFLTNQRKNINANKYDICFISFYRDKKTKPNPQIIQSLLDLNKELFQIVKNICMANNYSLCVALFSQRKSDDSRIDMNYEEEIEYYDTSNDSINIDYIPNSISEMGSYKTVLESNCTIGLRSTLLYESFGRGKRILLGNLLYKPENVYDKKLLSNMAGENIIYEMEEKHIQGKIETLMNMSDEEYIDKIELARNYYMRCERPYPHEMIKKRITEHLNLSTE